jgi:uncharacterized protein YjbJ (UPF0337 family)
MANDGQGKARHLQGKIKEGVGDLLGDRKLKREGRLDQAEARDREAAAKLARKRNENT